MDDTEYINVGDPCLYTQEAIDRAIKNPSKYKYRVLFTFGTGDERRYCNEIDAESFYDGLVILIRGDLNLQRTMLHQSIARCYYMFMFDKNKPVWGSYDD